MLDTLTASRSLKKSGFTEQQSDAIIAIFNDTHNNIATKDDINQLKTDTAHAEQTMSEKIDRVESNVDTLKSDVDILKIGAARIEAKVSELDKRMTMLQWMMGIFSGSIIALLVILITQISGA